MQHITIKNPYSQERIRTIELLDRDEIKNIIASCNNYVVSLTRFHRSKILQNAANLLELRSEQASRLITSETGLSLQDTIYEVKRVINLLTLGAHLTNTMVFEQVYHSDNSPISVSKKIISSYEPVNLIAAITPFNHPLNQVAHKVIPAIATNNKIIVKPSLKAPLSALYLAELLYEAGLPKLMFQVVLCNNEDVTNTLVADDLVELVAFTGSYKVGKLISSRCVMKRIILELGGCDPLIILADADINLAVKLARKGSFQNSGQRCTAIKRILVDGSIADKFVALFKEETEKIKYGNPYVLDNEIGTVIDEDAAVEIQHSVNKALENGAQLVYGNKRDGALMSPTIIDHVNFNEDIVNKEIFGPVAPIIRFNDIEDAIRITNISSYGLSAGLVTKSQEYAVQFIKSLKVGMVNINDVPSFRSEIAPFGGIKNSGIGVKEGIIESMRNYQNVKVFTFPW